MCVPVRGRCSTCPWFQSSAREAPLSLALQGGGAHGAFTWGVLDELLAHGAHPIRAISGTSAGALNAAVLAHGWLDGGADGARAALAGFWTAVGTRLPFEWFTTGAGDAIGLTPAARAMLRWARHLSPYQLNPMDLNPLRELLAEHVDFERLRRSSIVRLFIAATHANSGRLRVFRTREASVEAVLASACLPTLHHAIEIDGQPYWDGAYSANPALFPLIVMAAAPTCSSSRSARSCTPARRAAFPRSRSAASRSPSTPRSCAKPGCSAKPMPSLAAAGCRSAPSSGGCGARAST